MTGKGLLTRQDLLKDIFNNSKIDVKDVKKFLLYFAGILQLGVSEGLIDEAERNFIANAITNAIEQETIQEDDEDDEDYTNYVQIRNYMYIVSSYLQSKTNLDAWLELKSIKSTEDAIVLINNAKKWLETKLTDCKKELVNSRQYVLKLDLSNISKAYQILLSAINNAISCTSSVTKFELQDYHSSPLSTGQYILMNNKDLQNTDNFFIVLCNTIYSFCIEVSILYDIDAKELFKEKKREADLFFTDSSKKVAEVNISYKAKLSDLKKTYDKKRKKCYDENQLDEEYSIVKYDIEKEWEETVSKIEKGLEEEEMLYIEILSGEYSLYDFIKEYAIYQLALKDKIIYPSTIEERNPMLMLIDSDQAISEFISGKKELLTSKQIYYLKNCI